jgi:hypothetical protein
MMAERDNLTCGPRRVRGQRREVALRPAARFVSMRAMLSSKSRRTTSPGTVGTPAASSAMLSSRASAQPGGAFNGCGVSSTRPKIGL